MSPNPGVVLTGAMVTVLLLGLSGLSGCVTEGPPPRPKPKDAPVQPVGIAPDRVLPMAGQVMGDTDRNGYVDSLSVTVYLFAHGYDPAIAGDGSFEFELVGGDAKVIHKWVIGARAVNAAAKLFPAGPAYQFDVSLLDREGGDKLARQRGELWTKFVPTSGTPIESRSPLTVTLGPAPGGG